MTLYLVKWDDGSSALISAHGEDDLVDILDQLADPAAASWQAYEGPLWLEFPPIAAPDSALDVDPDAIELDRPSIAETDHGLAFEEGLLVALHPHVAALREGARPIPRAAWEAAVEADLACALPGSIYGTSRGPDH